MTLRKAIYLLILFSIHFSYVYAQTYPNPTPDIQLNGYKMNVFVDHSSTPSEEDIVYSVTFSLPLAATQSNSAFEIRLYYPIQSTVDDIILPSLAFSGITPSIINHSTGSSPYIALSFPNIPANFTPVAILGSFGVKVRVTADHACKDDVLNAYGLIHLPPENNLSTSHLHTLVSITNPWQIAIKAINTKFLGQGLACAYGTTSRIIKYHVEIHLYRNDKRGSQNLEVKSIIDQVTASLPAGTSLLFSTITPAPSVVLPPVSFSTNNTTGQLTISPGFVLDAVNKKTYGFEFLVTLPPNTQAQCVKDQILLTGEDPCPNSQIINSVISGTQIADYIAQSPQVNKFSAINGDIRGCDGKYIIDVKNPSTTEPMNGYTIYDFFPPCVTGVALLTNPTGAVCQQISTTPNVWSITSTTNFPAGSTAFEEYTFSYTVGPLCSGSYTNEIYDKPPPYTSYRLLTGVTNFLLPDEIVPCLQKTICNNRTFHVNDKIKFRLKIQNFGSIPMTNWKILDNLSAVGLDYDLNSAKYYFTYQSHFVDNNCTPSDGSMLPNTFPWTTASSTYNNGTLSFNFSTPAPVCNQFTAYESQIQYCGGGRNLPAFYVEFTATVTSRAGLGTALNKAHFEYDNANIGDEAEVPFDVEDEINLTALKEVSTDNGHSWGNGTNVTAGQHIQYRLSAANTGLTLFKPFLADYLPMNGPQYGTTDRYLLQGGSRGSTATLNYVQSLGSSIINPVLTFEDKFDLNAQKDFGTGAQSGTNDPNWQASVSQPIRNIRVDYPYLSYPLLSGSTLVYRYEAAVDLFVASGSTICNTFGIRGYKNALLNYTLIPDMLEQLPLESNTVCMAVGSINPGCCAPVSFSGPTSVCYGFEYNFCIEDDCCSTNQTEYTWNFDDNTPTVKGKCITHSFSQGYGIPPYHVTVSWNTCTGEEGSHEFIVEVGDCEKCEVSAGFLATTNGNLVHVDASNTTSNKPIGLYLWDFGDGEFGMGVTANHTYHTNGSFIVHLAVFTVSTNGDMCDACKGNAEHEVFVNSEGNKFASGKSNIIKQSKLEKSDIGLLEMNATPNPFSTNLNVSFKNTGGTKNVNAYSLLLVDANGKTIAFKNINDLETPVNLNTASYAPGIYLLLLRGAKDITKATKVVKLK